MSGCASTSCIVSAAPPRTWFCRLRLSADCDCSAISCVESSDRRALSTSMRSSVATIPVLRWYSDRAICAFSAVLEDTDGQILEAHSVSAGLDYPGVGPEHAYLRDSGRASYDAATDVEALRAFRELARLEGIIPALEPAHAIAWLLENGGGEGFDVLTLSGRGDKDMDEVTAKLSALDA